MAGHRPFNKLTKKFSPERRARVAAKCDHYARQYCPIQHRKPPLIGKLNPPGSLSETVSEVE
jgi:hypothetical protein